jgi:hypothetical protein
VTVYLLDENVIRELHHRGHTVDDSDLRLSAATLFEKRRGARMLRRRDPARATNLLQAIDALEKPYRDRIIPIDAAVVAEWSRLLHYPFESATELEPAHAGVNGRHTPRAHKRDTRTSPNLSMDGRFHA